MGDSATIPDGDDGDLDAVEAQLVDARAEIERLEAIVRQRDARVHDLQYESAALRWRLDGIRNRRPYALARLLRDVARDRGKAAELLPEARRIVTTRPTRPPKPERAPRVEGARDGEARAALRAGDYEQALTLADESLLENPRRIGSLDVRREALYKLGEITASLTTLHRMRELADSSRLAAVEAGILGRVRETDPTWLPRIPGPPAPLTPVAGRVMHLLKESAPYHVNGFCMRSRYTLLAQRDAGLDPFVVTSLQFPRRDGVLDFEPMELVDGIRHYRLDLGDGYPDKPPFDVALRDQAWLTAAVARDERPEIIHAGSGYRGYESALVALALREHLRIPVVYEVRSFFETTWTDEIERSERGEHYERRRATEDRCMRAADAVITIGEAMREEIISRGVPAERVFVAPNGADAELFRPRPRDPRLAQKWGVAGAPVFGYVSNLDHPREGQEFLVEATALLKRQGRDVRCLIVGDGPRREALQQLAQELGVDDRVVFTGRVPHEQVADLYALIDVFVVPRRNERAARLVTPLKPFEAMALGKAMLVSDLPALVELSQPEERGLSFRAEDAADLAAQVARLLDDEALRERVARAGQEWVLEHRTWRANGPRYRAVYDQVLEAWRTGRRIGEASGAMGTGTSVTGVKGEQS